MKFVGDIHYRSLTGEQLDFVIHQLVNANKDIKMRLDFIARFENSEVNLIEFEAICLNVRKITEVFCQEIKIFLCQLAGFGLSARAHKDLNYEKIFRFLRENDVEFRFCESAYDVVDGELGPLCLKRDVRGVVEALRPSEFRSLYSRCLGEILHAPITYGDYNKYKKLAPEVYDFIDRFRRIFQQYDVETPDRVLIFLNHTEPTCCIYTKPHFPEETI